jgi:AbrB family looped-hinge helix DNA binding protein
MRLTSKGQLTIPVEIRERLGLLPGTEVEFAIDGDGVRITRASSQTRGQQLLDHMRRHRGDVPLSTDEIMAMTRGE